MDDIITLSHGAGGSATHSLIEQVFKSEFDNKNFTGDDAAVLDFEGGRLAFTTDGFIVSPPFFAGGDIGKLSICGTVNDLACMGAEPLYLTCSFIIEEGFKIADLKTIAASMAKTAKEAGVAIVAGDTKVAGKGQCGGVFITTAGVGRIVREGIGGGNAKSGDAVIVTGDIGRHGCAILLARGDYHIDADIMSDCAPLGGLVKNMLDTRCEIHTIRDATRGGVGTTLFEIANQSDVTIELNETAIPIEKGVNGLCGMLGLEPLYMACEGRMVVIAPQNSASALLDAIKLSKYGKGAAIIGRVTDKTVGSVVINTAIGGRRLLPQPSGELLPRIC